MTEHFCDDCNRLRLTETGALTRASATTTPSAADIIRKHGSDDDVIAAIAVLSRQARRARVRAHGARPPKKHMIGIGG